MNNIKSFSIIDSDKINGNIHIVGVGAMGSMICEQLVRLNLASKIIVYDMDEVEDKNLNNQVFFKKHVGMSKVDAMKDVAAMIDTDAKLRGKNKRVEKLHTKSDDIVILCVDNYQSRADIIKSFRGSPLLISGGINAAGGNVEVTKGDYAGLIAEYESMESGQEYDEWDYTACGSPISIYHRIRTVASLACEQVVENVKESKDSVNRNIIVDLTSLFLMEE